MVLVISVLLEREVILVLTQVIGREEVRMVVEDQLVLIVMILALVVLVQHFSMLHQELIVIVQCFQRVF